MKLNFLDIKAPIFNIQAYSIHDGPGIRVTVFIKGCPLSCKWCANPESQQAKPQLMTYMSSCTCCGACKAVCPSRAISEKTINGKTVYITDRTRCIDCGGCIAACLNGARELAGKIMSVNQVLGAVLEDRLFLEASGGGLTLSGGECLMHPDFSEALLYAAKQEGLNTAVESSCYSSREIIKQVFAYADICLLDIKHMDSAEHKRLTGVPNELILENIKYIYKEMHKQTIIRIPVIPGCNDSRENIIAAAEFISKELGLAVPVNLLPYHSLGEAKNESLGKPVLFKTAIPDDEHMNMLKQAMEAYGLTVQIGG
jgi:pyruvate formate lyase activating enzyme